MGTKLLSEDTYIASSEARALIAHRRRNIVAKKLVWQIFLSCLGCFGVAAQDVQPEPRLERQPAPHIAGPSDPGYWTKERMEKARPMELHPRPDYESPERARPGTGKSPPDRRN